MVRLKIKKDKVQQFIEASIGDAKGSVVNEPGCRRFDIIQDNTDPTNFAFCEIYNSVPKNFREVYCSKINIFRKF